jgi:Ti-type conjugative transfer relaxase TraA
LAIYHLTANIISRARGQSVVAAAAYRSGAALRDERYGITHYHSRKRGIPHAEIMAPPGAPAWVYDREALWNRVEAGESRKDSQLARLIEIGLPVELSVDDCVMLVREYIAQEFVAQGMIADFCIRGDSHNPHAHILLTLRGVTAEGFGPKERRWNGKATLLEWRSAWADRANEHLARAGQAVRIDHRTLADQQIELTPGRRIGIGRPRQGLETLPSHLQERITEQKRIANENGAAILEDPSVVLRALTHQQPSFTLEDLARFLRSRTDGAEQFDAVLRAVTGSSEMMALDSDAGGQRRFTSRDMIEAAKSLRHRTLSMAGRRGHGVVAVRQYPVQPSLSEDQGRAFDYLVGEGDAKAIVLTDDARPPLLDAARRAWEAAGFAIFGAAMSRVAAGKLAAVSGVESRTVASREAGWHDGRDVLVRESVLLIDGAEMMGLKLLERLVAVADKARAKIVLIGNAAHMQTMKVESPFLDVLRRVGQPEAA